MRTDFLGTWVLLGKPESFIEFMDIILNPTYTLCDKSNIPHFMPSLWI